MIVIEHCYLCNIYSKNRFKKYDCWIQTTQLKNFLNFPISDFYGSHTWWARKLMMSDFLNLINIVFNIIIMDWWVTFKRTEAEFNEFKLRLKSPKNRFQLSAGLYLEKFNTILNVTNHIWATTDRDVLFFS